MAGAAAILLQQQPSARRIAFGDRMERRIAARADDGGDGNGERA